MTPAAAALLDRVVAHLAEQGIGDTSLRGIAAGVGSSHRMLLHHFGSRDGLLLAVVERVETGQRKLLDDLLGSAVDADVLDAGLRFWDATATAAQTYGPLLFELAAAAMQGRAFAAGLRTSLIAPWVESLAELRRRAGVAPAEAAVQARLDLAVARGLLQDLLLTDDREAVNAAMRAHIAASTRALTTGTGRSLPG